MLNKKYGKWFTLKEFKNDKYYHDYRYECICECGRIQIITRYCLRIGRSKSCKSCSHKKHGYHNTETYSIWQSMIQRTTNSNNRAWKYYGGRGISVCSRWLKFDLFLQDMGVRPEGLELDRIDTNGDYTKANCRWVTHSQNMKNRRKRHE